VLRELGAGRSNAAVWKTSYMSERAVEKHVSSVLQKLGLLLDPGPPAPITQML
jgi:DNA-binding NarL/FixJ family response regulator